jgi:hypothetical protein
MLLHSLSRWLIALLVLAAVPAQAHIRSESHALWEINGKDVDLIATIPVIEAQRLQPAGPLPANKELTDYLSRSVYPIADGKRCDLMPPVETLSAAPSYRKYDFTFRCATSGQMQVRWGAFFDLVPSHINFAQIRDMASGEFTEQLMTNEHQIGDVSGAGSELEGASFLEFVGMGVMHIFTGVDHMSFLLGLVLLSRRLRDLLFVVTGFTIGHSLTLALAVTGVIRPQADYIDALVALTIALVGAEIVAVQTRRPGVITASLAGGLAVMAAVQALEIGKGLPSLLLLGAGLFSACYLTISGHLRDAGRLRLVVTLVFGLIHGFGFAAGLLEMQLPPHRLAELLLGFNIGVEIGQLAVVITVSLLAIVLSRIRLGVSRPLIVDGAAAFLVGLGVFWFVTRSYA